MRDEQPLIDLVAFLHALLLESPLALNTLARRHQARKAVGDGIEEFADTQRLAAIGGHRVVDGADMAAQEPFPNRARARLDLLCVALGLLPPAGRRAKRAKRGIGGFEILGRGIAVGGQRRAEIDVTREILNDHIHGSPPHSTVVCLAFWYNDVLLKQRALSTGQNQPQPTPGLRRATGFRRRRTGSQPASLKLESYYSISSLGRVGDKNNRERLRNAREG